MNDPDALVSLADVAEMAHVSRPAVSNWRRRYPDFPRPVSETGATSLFRLGDLMAWMAKHDKQLDVRSVDQLVWSALNPARGAVLPEEAAQAGMILLGYLALAFRSDKTIAPALRAAITGNDQQALGKLLARLDEQAAQLGLGELFPAKLSITWSAPSRSLRSFLSKMLDLAQEHGVSAAFEALIAAGGRGSRGEGEYTTPSGVADLIMSLAAPVGGVLIDPACGYGTLLLAASQAATAQLMLIGQDISSDACHIARLRMFVHDLPAHIIHGDTLRADEPTLMDFDKPTIMDTAEADLVVGDPPVAMKWHPERADTRRMPYGIPPASRSDLAWLQDGISRLSPDGVAMFVLGHGAMFRGGAEGEVRRRLLESGCIHAVVALPPALYPTTTVAISLWIASKPRQHGERRPGGNSVLLVDATQLGNRRGNKTELNETDLAAINRCFRAWREHGQLATEGDLRADAVPVGILLDGGSNLNPARWIKDPAADPEQRLQRMATAERELRTASARLGGASFSIPPLTGPADSPEDSWEVRKVTDLATLIRPRRIDPDLFGTGDTPLIRNSDIGPDLTVIPSSRVELTSATDKVELTRPGDVVVVTGGAKPRAAVDHLGGAVVSAPLQVVRPRPGSIDPVVLAAFITSIGPKYAVGTTVGHLDLTALEVPCPDPRTSKWLSQALEALGTQRRAALAAVRAIDELRTELVDGLGSQTIRQQPHATGEGGGEDDA
jgi:type I restriction-modification system DNA methylase subunit